MERNSKYIDDLLIDKVKEGDSKAFEELYYIYSERLYYFALRYLKTKEDAEGLVQEIFIRVWENRNGLKRGLSFNAYLFTIAKNTIFNQHRKKVNENAYKEYLKNYIDQHHNKTENDVVLADMKTRIDKSIESLPPQRKLIFQLSRNEGLSYKEIASKLNISEKTVEAHMRLALKTLRAAVKAEIFFPLLFAIPGLF
ncbi:MAG: RNA polymerase sigma-70 factor [Bacteroidetes bacterium]|nr:RNA polymerase sigma-70 factor [Bacteroidota bacterium]